jgi:DNA-binding NtrC family response regulator
MTIPASLKGANVLLLEDDPIQAMELISSLTDVGALVVGPHAGLDDAKSAVLDTRCDAAIIDLRLGDRNASGFANFLRLQKIPFIIFSAYPDSAHLGSDSASWEFVQKPADADRVVRALSELVARLMRPID